LRQHLQKQAGERNLMRLACFNLLLWLWVCQAEGLL